MRKTLIVIPSDQLINRSIKSDELSKLTTFLSKRSIGVIVSMQDENSLHMARAAFEEISAKDLVVRPTSNLRHSIASLSGFHQTACVIAPSSDLTSLMSSLWKTDSSNSTQNKPINAQGIITVSSICHWNDILKMDMKKNPHYPRACRQLSHTIEAAK